MLNIAILKERNLEFKFLGKNLDLIINSIVSIDNLNSKDKIAWCSDKNIEKYTNLEVGNLILSEFAFKLFLSKNPESNINFIIVSNPRLFFTKLVEEYFSKKVVFGSISNSAYISSSAILDKQKIILGHNVVIEENVQIGDNVIIDSNSVIKANTIIGSNVKIGSNCTVGGMGFGYEKDENGNYVSIPHIGNVVIEDHVEIGNNVCIDRAVLGSTILKKNVKVDNLVHIAHGVIIDENSLIIANAMIGGSTEIGKNVWIAPSSTLMQKIKIEDNATVGLGAVVLKSVEEGSIVVGNPAKKIERK